MDFSKIENEFFLDDAKTLLDKNKLKYLRNILKEVNPDELKTIDDHKKFVFLLRKFREEVKDNNELNGENFNSTLTSILAVGADGLYQNDLRFIFELIQNVDDCDYDNLSDCQLEMHFDFNLGTITLEYNEIGFSPFNVFSITGIAEAAKNISPKKIEIGEKGIGFKSVFGIAEKVLVQSGLFSFMLYKNNYTVPIEQYEEFSEVKGTRLTLFVQADVSRYSAGEKCKQIYNKLVSEYCHKTALFNKNPILFLNKLTKIRLYYDVWDSLEFHVAKGQEKILLDNGLEREDNVVISSVLSSREKHLEKQENIINCTRYTMPIIYNRNMCVSRYGSETAFEDKEMNLQVVIPEKEYASELSKGTLYSFLPTQVKTTVPISCHIPFKLDSSRENVDNQGENEWFSFSRNEFSKMLKSVYEDYSKMVKQGILEYLPLYDEYFFLIEAGNDKLNSLKYRQYLGSTFLQQPILYTAEDRYKGCNDVFGFVGYDSIENPLNLYKLLNYVKDLFIPETKCNLGAYGIEVVQNVYYMLFAKAINGEISAKEVLEIIDSIDCSYQTFFKRLPKKRIPYELLSEISMHPKCLKAFNDLSAESIKGEISFDMVIDYSCNTNDAHYVISNEELIDESALDTKTVRYLRSIKFSYITADIKESSYFIAKNILVLSSKNPLYSFAKFCEFLGEENDHFSANLKMREASMRLDEADDSLSAADYLKLLRQVRGSIKNAFGKRHYEGYIRVIRELNADPQRFIQELLQNADDCYYDEDLVPSFKLSIDGTKLVTKYNEIGFEKKHVRAITAISESTKKQVYNGNYEIGEKGIGFKTVFAVADSVDIHSNGFHFRLKADTPTIPDILQEPYDNSEGTSMIFNLKRQSKIIFKPEQVLSLCLCLKNLKDITIDNINVHIEDKDSKRIITIGNKEYIFDVYKHYFVVNNSELLKERNTGGKNIPKNQKITFYIPNKSIPNFHHYLYSGLPTTIEIGVPFVIDVPFELTASRENVIQNRWNEFQRNEMYSAYINILPRIALVKRIEVLDYLRFVSLQFGKFSLFKNNDWLSNYDIIDSLRECRFIPTYDKTYFVSPSDDSLQYPSVIHTMLSEKELDVESKRRIIEDKNNRYDSIIKNLRCKMVSYEKVIEIIVKDAYSYINNEKFRNNLYRYLQELSENCKNKAWLKNLRNARIIPVKGENDDDDISFVSFNDGELYVDDNARTSSAEYSVIDTSICSKQMIEKMLDVHIQIMDDRLRKSIYKEQIENIITSSMDNSIKYASLIYELSRNKRRFEEAIGVLLANRHLVPLLMEDGEYRCDNVFVTRFESGYFNGPVIKSHIVSEDAVELAQLMQCKDISRVIYDDLDIENALTADDIEDLQLPEIKNGYTILEQSMYDGYVSNELIERYGLNGIKRTDFSDTFDEDDFPNEPVKSTINLKAKIIEESKKVRKIVKVEVRRTVDGIQLPNGEIKSFDASDIRESTLRRYRPSLNTDACFCQMCCAIKSSEYIETNNIWPKPEYYWPQMRISLCLECSKKFESLRANYEIMDRFYENIELADIKSDEAVSIPIGNSEIKFTQTHLAEIQEILKSGKK